MPLDFELLKLFSGFVSIIGGTVGRRRPFSSNIKTKKPQDHKWGGMPNRCWSLFPDWSVEPWLDYTRRKTRVAETAISNAKLSEQTLRIVTDISRTLESPEDVRASFWLRII